MERAQGEKVKNQQSSPPLKNSTLPFQTQTMLAYNIRTYINMKSHSSEADAVLSRDKNPLRRKNDTCNVMKTMISVVISNEKTLYWY